jgi:SPOR domain
VAPVTQAPPPPVGQAPTTPQIASVVKSPATAVSQAPTAPPAAAVVQASAAPSVVAGAKPPAPPAVSSVAREPAPSSVAALATSQPTPPVAEAPAASPHRTDPVATLPEAAMVALSTPLMASGIEAAVSRPADPPTAQKPIRSGHEAFVQLGSLVSESDAMLEWRRLRKRTSDLLTGRRPSVVSAEVHGRTYWRLRTFGFASLTEANEMCNELKAAGFRCWPGQGL